MSLARIDRLDQNLLINGLVKPLCQRLPGGVATLTSSFQYQIIDRFMGRYVGNFNSTPTWEVLGDFSVMNGDFTDSSGSLELQQRVESLLAESIIGKKASVSMELYSESCNRVTLSLYYPLVEDDWSTEQIITSETFDIPVNADHAIKWENIDMGYDVNKGVQLRVKFHNPQTLNAVTGHKIKRIKLSAGEKAQEWSPCGRNLIEELSLCQRYYEELSQELIATIGNNGYNQWQFKTQKREIPNTQLVGGNGAVHINYLGVHGAAIYDGSNYPIWGVGSYSDAEL